LKVPSLFALTVEASSPNISKNPTLDAPDEVAVNPEIVSAPAEYSTEFHCLIIIHPVDGIVPPFTSGAEVSEEYTHISFPDELPWITKEFKVGIVPEPPVNCINLTYLPSILHVPPSVAEMVIEPIDVAAVVDVFALFNPYRECWSIVSTPPLMLKTSPPVLPVNSSIFCVAVIVNVAISLHLLSIQFAHQ
jgi:hypothetical protein